MNVPSVSATVITRSRWEVQIDTKQLMKFLRSLQGEILLQIYKKEV